MVVHGFIYQKVSSRPAPVAKSYEDARNGIPAFVLWEDSEKFRESMSMIDPRPEQARRAGSCTVKYTEKYIEHSEIHYTGV